MLYNIIFCDICIYSILINVIHLISWALLIWMLSFLLNNTLFKWINLKQEYFYRIILHLEYYFNSNKKDNDVNESGATNCWSQKTFFGPYIIALKLRLHIHILYNNNNVEDFINFLEFEEILTSCGILILFMKNFVSKNTGFNDNKIMSLCNK